MNFNIHPLWAKLQKVPEAKVHRWKFDYFGTETQIAVSDPRWVDPNAPWTDRDDALLLHAYRKFFKLVQPLLQNGEGEPYTFGEALEFARAHPDYQIWMNGEIIQ